MRRVLLFLLIGFAVGPIMAQQNARVATNAISSSDTGSGKLYYVNNSNEPPRAIEFKERTVTASQLLSNLNQYFDIPAEYTFTQVESNTDDLGMQHHFLQQYYQGVPVEGMGYRVHEKDGFVTSANGRAIRNIELDTQAGISEEQAFRMALNYLQAKDTVFRNARKLIVSKGFTFTPESFYIAFQFDISVSFIEQWRVSIDARNGQLLNKVSLVNTCFKETPPPLPYTTGTGLTNYYGNQTIRVEQLGQGSRLVGQTEHGGKIGTYDFRNVNVLSLLLFFEFHKVYDIYSSNNTYNSPYHKPAVSAQWAAEQAYEYYFNKHNRNSFDNNGSVIKCYVHVGQNLNNAFWAHNILAFGDGSNNNPLVELDVVSHELTHGVTQYEARLQYYNEPGALNESFSDILGKAVEFDTFGDTATWQLAKHYREGGLRDMSNPNLKDQPDTYAGDMWHTGYEDNGGVHYNSGVQNFWFYLLCEGGSGVNDHGLSYSINAIGIEAATKIAYRNLTEYLSSQSDYLDSRIGSLLATADLYGKNSAIYQEVDKAWDAVGVIDEPIVTSLEVYDITGTTVKIKGSLLPRGDTVTYHFEYGTTPAFGSSTSIYKYTNTVEGIIRGLQSETKYYLRLVATNENGNTYATTEFTTISLAPLVKIKPTVDVTETSATLYGEINPNSLPTSFYFEYGLTAALGLVTPSYPMSDTTEFLNVSAPITGLQARQTYYYRLIANNGFASSATGPVSFFTAVKPVITSYTPVTAPIGAEVTIAGQHFHSMPEKNLVRFGATRATVLSASPTEIKVKVPAGASLGPITVLDAESGLAGESIREFVPTFTDEFKKGNLQLTMGVNDYIYQTHVQDMDGDGRADIVARHYLGYSIFLNVNQGGDITEESFVRSTFNGEETPQSLSLADFDGNGLKDIVGRYRNGWRIYPNLSVPGFIFFGPPVDLPATLYLYDAVFGDFDIDGRIDIAGTDDLPGDSTSIVIFRNQNPRGLLTASNFEKRHAVILPYHIYNFNIDDLTNDGKPDLLVAVYNKSFVPIVKNNSHPGAFHFEVSTIEYSPSERYPQYISQDLNQDGWKDIAITSLSSTQSGNLLVLENKGTAANISMANAIVAVRESIRWAVQPGDVNGDGNIDLLVGINGGKFTFIKNNVAVGEELSELSFEKFETFTSAVSANSTQSGMAVNDLNGDGRPEVINTYSYNHYPHKGYTMEIWQNAPAKCLDPSLITLNVSNYTATIVLPPNTTLDQFEIEYSISNYNYWNRVYSTTLNLQSGYSYQLRARAKCYLGFTDYHYINFTTDCVDTNSFSVTNVGVNSVNLQAYNLSSFEIQYSPAGKDEWSAVSQNASQILNLLPGTTYDVRFRGRCYNPSGFKYKQFTTLCPQLSRLTITDLRYDKAVVNWTSSYAETAILEYSTDNVSWILIDESRTMFPLSPAREYFVRGRMACTNINSDFIYASFTTPCPKVSDLYIDTVTPFSARINWGDESDGDTYTVTYALTAGGAATTVETGATSLAIDGLSPGTHYTVAVAPACINAPAFTSTSFSTVCYVPFNLSANAITHTTAELSWSDNFGGLPYFVDYTISGSNIWLTTETVSTSVSLAELRPGTEYEARAHINCLSETAPYASVFFETNLYLETTFAPNPTDSKITIYPSKNLIGKRFGIYDNAGRAVASGELLDYTFDLSDFFAGFYTLKIDGEKTIKIVKH